MQKCREKGRSLFFSKEHSYRSRVFETVREQPVFFFFLARADPAEKNLTSRLTRQEANQRKLFTLQEVTVLLSSALGGDPGAE